MCGPVTQLHCKHPNCTWKGKITGLLRKKERSRGLQLLGGALFSLAPPGPGVLRVEGRRSWWHCATCVVLQPLSPLHLRQSLEKAWEEDAGKQRISLGLQQTNSTWKSWKAWGKYFMQSTELPPTLSDCISLCIVFNHYSGTVTCSNLLLQLHLGFTWQSLIKIELPGLQNKHLIKAECF